MGKMKVALLSTSIFPPCPDLKYAGIEAVVHNLGVALAKDGHEVLVVGTKGTQVEGCEVLETVELSEDRNCFDVGREAYEIWKNQVDGFDVVHGHNCWAFEYLYAREHPDATVVQTHHGGINWRREDSTTFPNLLAVSQFAALELRKLGYPARHAYNGIDLDDYPFKEEKGDRLLFTGRFTTSKGVHLALEVARKTGLGLDLVGPTHSADQQYGHRIRDQCDGERFRVWGEVSKDVKVQLMQDAKAILIPSQWGEPFGLIAAEAMACGTPALCLNDGALKEVVAHGRTGFICDSLDQMVQAVHRVDEMDPRRCRQRVENLFSKEVMAQNYLHLYREAQTGGW